MGGNRVSTAAVTLFERHGALFVDKEDDDGVYPRLLTGRSENDIHATFDAFYNDNVIYDLTRQWITKPGPFTYNFRWLSQTGSDHEIQEYAERSFEAVYGVRPSNVEVL